MQLFKEEFSGLPEGMAEKLLKRVEEIVRLINGRYSQSQYDYRINNYTKEEISAMFHAVFDLAQRLKNH